MATAGGLRTVLEESGNKSLGFAISKYGYNQLAYQLAKQCFGKPRELLIFYENLGKSWLVPPFALFNIAELFDFQGPVVATNHSTANFLTKCPGPTKRFFYVYDMDWRFTMDNLEAVYRNPSLRLVARSEDHRKMIEDAWNRSVCAVVEDCSLDDFYDLVDDDA